jgi:hypothetical protein
MTYMIETHRSLGPDFFTAAFGNVVLQPSANTPSPTGAVGVGMGYSNGIGRSVS